jgi:diguanylate cyclase (GGDEF)-like protein
MGTWEGLVRYNGFEFEVFDRANTPALHDSGVRALAVGADGRLVVGTSRGGVSVRAPDGAWRHLGRDDGLPQDDTMAVLVDRADDLWIATESAGVVRLHAGGAERYTAPERLQADITYTVFEAADGGIWVGTVNGPARLQGGASELFDGRHGLPYGAVFAFAQDDTGRLFLGTEYGVYVSTFDGRFEPLAADLPVDAIPSLRIDAQGLLWIGTVNHGLIRYDPGSGRAEAISSIRGLPNNRIASLFIDREGSLWAGTNAGLLQLRDALFQTFGTEQRLSDDYVRTVLEARDGAIWIGTSRGLNRLAPDGALQAWGTADGLPGDSILSLHEDPDGSLWVGTYASGLARWRDGRVVQRWTREDALPGNQVRAIVRDGRGALWVGTYRGLARIDDDGATRTWGSAEGLPREYVLALHLARDGRLWVGTAGGAAVLEGERVTAVDLAALDDARDVFGFHEEPDGTLWMATDRGLVRRRPDGALAIVGIAQGLPVATLFQIVADDDDQFWLTTNRGILRLPRQQAARAADTGGRVAELAWFGEADGMASAQNNGGSTPAAMRTRAGALWFATSRGVAIVQPERLLRYRRTPPPVALERLIIDDVERPLLSDVGALPPGTRKLELHFAGLSYLTPGQVRYRYRLEGFDADWVERGRGRVAQYTNLPPGEYRFRVSAANPGGDWNPEEATLVFRVDPLPWERPAYWLAGVALLLALAYLLYRLRVRQLVQREETLLSMVDQRTLDLRQHTERLLQADLEKSALLGQLRQQSEAFERQAREDALTGLPNRRSVEETLAASFALAKREDQPLAVALVDVDHFKAINDRHSHAVGDAALRAIARTMRAVVAPGDVVGRWGGEEFVLVFAGADEAEARLRAERVRAAIEAMDVQALASGLAITASIGVATRSGHANPDRMLSRADAALYEAKREGRNRVCG